MIRNNHLITELAYGDIVQLLAESRKLTIDEARRTLSGMSFSDYLALIETITPPSGNTIAPGKPSTPGNNSTPTGIKPPAPGATTPSWPGGNAPLTAGMSVSIKDDNGNQIQRTVSTVDSSANGVKVRDPVTGKEEWANIDSLEPVFTEETVEDTDEDDINRLRELAGIRENSSAGASCAGAIASSPASLGAVQKRAVATEAPKKEYTRKGPAKTVVGDTKPWQASGELSATLAANGKKTASRSNNGFKK